MEQLRHEIERWFAKWTFADPLGAHRSQLEALRETTGGLLERVSEQLGADTSGETTGETYDRCRLNDLRIVHVRRLWRYFADKFDQRFDHRLQAALTAADEVAWSCFASAEGLPGWTRAAPLSFFDARLAPTAFVREDVPIDLRPAEALLQQLARLLPIPVTAVPPVCVDRPWWLVLLAHETGHQLQSQIAAGSMVPGFAGILSKWAGQHGQDRDLWLGWSRELFADAFAVLAAGPWVAWALGELERSTPDGMRTSLDARYPPPVVRAAFMAGVAASAGWPSTAGHDAIEADPDGTAATMLEAAGAFGAAIVDEPLGSEDGPSLALLSGLGRAGGTDRAGVVGARQRKVDQWRRAIREKGALKGDVKNVDGARLGCAASTAAWADAVDKGPPPAEEVARLRDRTLELMAACHVEGVRAATGAERAGVDTTAALEATLFGATAEQLGSG